MALGSGMKKLLISLMVLLTVGFIAYAFREPIQHQIRMWTDLEYVEQQYQVIEPPYGLRETTVSLSGIPLMNYDEIASKDQQILIMFWYVDCHWCELSFPALKKVHERVLEEELDFVVIGLNFIDDAAYAQQEIDALGVEFENYVDAKLPRGAIGTPFTVVLERTESGEWVPIEELTWRGFIGNDELIWGKIDNFGD